MSNKRNSKWGWMALIVALSTSIFWSCAATLDVVPTAKEEGSVSLSIQDNSRTLLPGISMVPSSYDLVFTSVGQATVTDTLTLGSSLQKNLASGSWSLTVEAKNNETPAKLIGRGTATFTVVTGATSSVTVQLAPLVGKGTLSLQGNVGTLGLTNPSVELELKAAGATQAQYFGMTLTSGVASFSKADLDAGYYSLILKLKDGALLKGSNILALRVVEGAQTLGNLKFTQAGAVGATTFVIEVEAGTKQLHSAKIVGLPSTVTLGDTFPLTVETNAVGAAFAWKLDGVVVPGATSASWTVPSSLNAGTHRVDAVVTVGADSVSDFVAFDVSPGVIPPYEVRLYFKSTAVPTIWIWETGTGGREITKLMNFTWDAQPSLIADAAHAGWYYFVIPESYYPVSNLSIILDKSATTYTIPGEIDGYNYWFNSGWHIQFPEGPTKPSIAVSPAGTSGSVVPFNVGVTITSSTPVLSKHYKIDSGSWIALDATTLSLGASLLEGQSFTLTVKATNDVGETIVGPYTYSRTAPQTSFDQRELRMYQVMVGTYIDGDSTINYNAGYGPGHHKGDLKGITQSLTYIKSLGVNALWMTPIFHSFSGDRNGQATGYFADNYFAIDPDFGTEQDFKDLVAAAHGMGIHVILDGVFGHHGADVQASPMGKKPAALKAQWYGTQVDYNNPDTVAFYKEVAVYWIEKYGIDGWRLDQAYQVPIWAWKEIRTAVEQASLARKNAGQQWGTLGYMVGEIWDGNPANIQKDGYGTTSAPGLLSNFDFPVRYALVQVLATQEHQNDAGAHSQPASKINDMMNSLATTYPAFANANLMITNHDLVNFGDLIQRAPSLGYGPENPDYWKRHKLALSFMGAWTGAVTLYYGDEYGHEVANFVQTSDRGFYDDHVSRDSGRTSGFNGTETDLVEYAKSLMTLRATYPALWRGTRTNLIADATRYADLKTDGNQKIVYLMNVGTSSATFSVSGVGGSSLKDLQSNETISGSGTYTVNVPALSARFLIVQ